MRSRSKSYMMACKFFDLHRNELHSALTELAQLTIDGKCTKLAKEELDEALLNYVHAEIALELEKRNK